MGVSKVKITDLTILGKTPDETELAIMHYYVGWALTRWHHVEQDLTIIYLMLTCPKDTPVDGALASFTSIQTIDAKVIHLTKVLNQVLYLDELGSFRKEAKSILRRVASLNDTRNKLAHGIARIEEGRAVFSPFYNRLHDFRRRSFVSLGPTPSIISPTSLWNVDQVREKAQTLSEGPEKTLELVHRVAELCEDGPSALQTARRMTLDRGIPHDQNPPKMPPPKG